MFFQPRADKCYGDFNKLKSDIFVASLQFVQPPQKNYAVRSIVHVEVPRKQLNPDFSTNMP